jgi:hypothetical protein
MMAADTGSGLSVRPLALDTSIHFEGSLPSALQRTTFVRELEPDARKEPALSFPMMIFVECNMHTRLSNAHDRKQRESQ